MQFAQRGAKLALWDLDADTLAATATEIRSAVRGVVLHTYACNLADKEAIYAAAVQVKADLGDVDVVVNNAGVVQGAYLLDPGNTDAKNELTFAVNTMAHFYIAKAFLGAMVQRNSGNFVVVSSMAAVVGAPAMVDYSASKASAKVQHYSRPSSQAPEATSSQHGDIA
jgi:all-trans-retinol dehydrogenase (NAD+)